MERSRRIQVQLSPALDERLAKAARRSGVTKSAFIRVALEREFAHDRQLARECARQGLVPESEPPVRDRQLQLFSR